MAASDGLTAVEEVTIHFVEDGMTAFGRVWLRGQEIKIATNDPHYAQTLVAENTSWLNYTEDEQIAKWGKRMFRAGPWRGKSVVEAEWEDPVYAPSKEQLLAAEQAEARRAGRIPAATQG